MIQWIIDKITKKNGKIRHNIVKLNWKKAELEKLLKEKDDMTPEEFQRVYQRLI